MVQFKMLWKRQSVKDYPADADYSFRSYKDGDELGWIEACKEGLVEDDYSIDDFHEKILGDKYVDKDNIFFLVNQDDNIVATITARKTDDPRTGYVHMVGVNPKYRGKKLSKPIMAYTMKFFYDNSYEKVYLTTDDWRVPAVKLYLDFDFKPCLIEDDMIARWQVMLKKFNMDSIKAYDINENDTIINSK